MFLIFLHIEDNNFFDVTWWRH